MSSARILIVEDEGIEALDIQQRLISMGYTAPDIVSTGEEAIKKAGETSPDLVLMDIMLPGEIDGVTAAEQIQSDLDIPFIYITAYADENTLQRAKLTEPYGYIVKPFRERELHITIDMALYKHKMKKKLKESEKWFATTLRSIGDAVLATDENGLVTFMNPVAEELMGWQMGEVVGKKITEVFKIINMYSREPAENPVTRVILEGSTMGLANHTLLITKNGEEIPIDDSAAPIKDDKANIIGVVLVFRDVRERNQAEEALRSSEERYRTLAEELHEADHRKNEFLAVLSHELRNPLAAIRNSLNILDRVLPGEGQSKRAKDIIERQVGQLSHLVDDLLDITRIKQNKIQLQRQRHELNELVRRTMEDHRALFEKSGVRLEAEFAPTAIFLNVDGVRLAQVIGNLLMNAAKFTERGGNTRVSIACDALLNQAVIRVIDNGVGMAPEMLSRLFQPFMQAHTNPDRSRSGLGLGLALSKGLIELHGGSVSAYSAGIGKGAEFVICLPLGEVSAEDPRDGSPIISHHCRRVLIIDDLVDVADTLCELLKLNSHEVEVAYSGPEGLDKARKFHPEIVLCDIGLPNMDGYDIARAFRRDEALNNIFLVALTGYAMPEDLQRAADAGFDYHLAKPVELDELNRMLAKLPDSFRAYYP
ncbi:MAG: response regulator [Desulfotomaculaceae bacterium]|nr:response regulator [Desulfotomaculaceae bacterium]